MPRYYTYLISSLPMLHFGMKPPFSFEKFLVICKDLIADEDTDALKRIDLMRDDPYPGQYPVLDKWQAYDRQFRNELAKIRASRRHMDPQKYVRGDSYVEPRIAHAAMASHRTPSIVDAERGIDQERWRTLEELEIGHYFDIEFLLIYALKLQILIRWQIIRSADKGKLLNIALAAV